MSSGGWRHLTSFKALAPAAALAVVLAFAVAAPAASAAMDVFVTAETLRSLSVEASTSLPPVQAAFFRGAADADGSGSVSQEESSILISTIDALVADASTTDVDAYGIAWARENETGAAGITVEGRANLSTFAYGQAQGLRWSAVWDSANGTLSRAATTFTGLTGPVKANATLGVLYEVSFDFPALDRNEPVHRLSVSLPPGLNVSLTVGGALEVVDADALAGKQVDGSKSTMNGTTTAAAPVFLVKERAVSNEAFTIVLIAVVVPTALVALVAVYALPRMRVPDPELIVEPKYK